MPSYEVSRKREDKLVAWLQYYSDKVDAIFFLGDVFDFWFEYKHSIPKGYSRFLGKVAELSDQGIQLYFFKGNHDMWMFDYFQKELNAKIISNELTIDMGKKQFYLHHGDGLGSGDYGYKLLKTVFRSKVCQWLFARLHPNFGIGLAKFLSQKSRLAKGDILEDQGPEKEILERYIREIHPQKNCDYYVCGHRHLPKTIQLSSSAKYINLGDWFMHCSYAYFDGTELALKYFENELIA